MSRTRNINRYRRTYPTIRKTPNIVDVFSGGIEHVSLRFDNTSSVTYNFREIYKRTPTVTAIAAAVSGYEDLADINPFIKSVDRLSVTVGVSDAFTGDVQIQIIDGKSEKQNTNREKKIFPGIRRLPVKAYEFGCMLESGLIPVQNSDHEVYTFEHVYNQIPAVVVTAANDTVNTEYGDVNAFIKDINKFYVTIGTSDKLTGTLYVQVVGN